MSLEIDCTVVDSLEAVSAADWNALCGPGNPFVRHEFLRALESTGCVGERTGWEPCHLLVRRGPDLIGASPMYAKHHSYGEYVFDWAWADAYNRYGYDYFPKLVVAIPFTPVTGPRLLAKSGEDGCAIRAALIDAARQVAEQLEASSVHWLFTDQAATDSLKQTDLLGRTGCQYHWRNAGFRDFDDFLDTLTSKRRKQIKRERRQARSTGLEIEMISGSDISEAQWDAFYGFYCLTYDRKWGMPYLNAEFFKTIAEQMPESVSLVLASRDGTYVAGALCLQGADGLFGRNWGCNEYHPALHFEMCYYQTIERCITLGLDRFEAGAQGEYKMSRGLLPSTTHSYHWIAQPDFRRAIAHFLDEERVDVSRFVDYMESHSPYNKRSAGRKARDTDDSGG